MIERLDYLEINARATNTVLSANKHIASIDKKLRALVELRVSQINGCAFCIHMHTHDARAQDESEDRLHLLNAWRESSLYSGRERAALA